MCNNIVLQNTRPTALTLQCSLATYGKLYYNTDLNGQKRTQGEVDFEMLLFLLQVNCTYGQVTFGFIVG